MMIMQTVIQIIEILLFLYLGVAALYVLIFSVAGLIPRKMRMPDKDHLNRMVVMIPGYKEDEVIVEVARDALKQNYPETHYDVVVIADSFRDETLDALKKLPIRVIEVEFEKSTKSKSLNAAMDQLGDNYDVAVILDADNLMRPEFLELVNQAYNGGARVTQGHRTAKNLNTSMAILDAISEEINNHIFRKGHRVLRLSSALIGSAMAFDYIYFKTMMKEVKAVGGFDKELELRILREQVVIEYLDQAYVLDEKVQKKEVFASQRRRWLSAQWIYFTRYIGIGFKELFARGNIDLFDKVYQMVQPPRVILIGLLTLISMIIGILTWIWPESMISTFLLPWYGWLALWGVTLVALLLAVPAQFYNRKTVIALFKLPGSFFIMMLSLFRLRGANKRFIHTTHGIEDKANKQ